jgi:hypothetical protein
MDTASQSIQSTRPVHSWLRKIRIAYAPGKKTPLLDHFSVRLLDTFERLGHKALSDPITEPDVILTTAVFGEPINWREAMLFTARRRFKLEKAPLVFTLVHARPDQIREQLDYFSTALAKEPADPQDFQFPGLAPTAYTTLYEQGRRGGPILSLVRLVQSQTMSIRIILVVGDEQPEYAYTFDLVGSHPRSEASQEGVFYEDLALRIITAASTEEVTQHQVEPDIISRELWQSLTTPHAMRKAGRELGKRNFFTEMVSVERLVNVPAVHESVSRQYSEGCFATWDPVLNALISTVTGSARPVEKDNLTDDELAVISGIRADGMGAIVRHVEGSRNDPPSSEAVELMEMDTPLPQVSLSPQEWRLASKSVVMATAARSKLHGHRGVRSFDPLRVEHVPLDEPYYHYPVSCSTEAQARSIRAAFSRSQALQNPDDPRQIVFTVMPGHGIVIVEKWVPGKEPFQVIWEAMDSGALQIDNHIPQGSMYYIKSSKARMELVERS